MAPEQHLHGRRARTGSDGDRSTATRHRQTRALFLQMARRRQATPGRDDEPDHHGYSRSEGEADDPEVTPASA